MVSLSAHTPSARIHRIVDGGGILTLPGVPLARHLVGDMRWLSDRALGWIAADDNPLSARVLHFERLEIHSFGVAFQSGSNVVAILTSIEQAGLEDTNEYRNAWTRGSEVAASRVLGVDLAFAAASTLLACNPTLGAGRPALSL